MDAADDIAWSAFGRYLRDGETLCWPERAIGRATAINVAEVERALARPARSKVAPAPVRVVRVALVKIDPAMNLSATARQMGITPAALVHRIRRHGLQKALSMGAKMKHRWAAAALKREAVH